MLYNNKKFIIHFSIIVAASLFFAPPSFGSEIDTDFFNVKMDEAIDQYGLLKKLDMKSLLRLTALPQEKHIDIGNMLKDTLDALYLEVSDILDMHMYSFEINLEILPNKEYLNGTLSQYGVNNVNTESYYFYEKNTVYISFEDLTVGVLSHEIAHAIVSHYFVILPSEKTQEILCGYVEYSIKKALDKYQ